MCVLVSNAVQNAVYSQSLQEEGFATSPFQSSAPAELQRLDDPSVAVFLPRELRNVLPSHFKSPLIGMPTRTWLETHEALYINYRKERAIGALLIASSVHMDWHNVLAKQTVANENISHYEKLENMFPDMNLFNFLHAP